VAQGKNFKGYAEKERKNFKGSACCQNNKQIHVIIMVSSGNGLVSES
jgi:hypothetical protein